MKHVSVTSSNLVSVAHDPNTKTLEVKFKNGSTYQYEGVPVNVHREMMDSPSVGKFFNAHIKDRY